MKTSLLSALFLIIALTVIVITRANLHFEDRQVQVAQQLQPVNLDAQGAVQRFARSIQFATVSHDDRSQFDPQPFLQLHQHITDAYPLIHQRAEKKVFSDYSLLYHLQGADTNLKPVLFMGHMDVVPVDPVTESEWKHPPFSGAIVDDTIWGRGTIDDKITVMALLEAMELMLANGITPQRSIYFAFGHDEEVGGNDGAKQIAAYFKQQGTQFEFVLDEGGAITQGLVAGFEQPVATVGIAEKGYLNLRLTVNAEGGHSSQPPPQTAAGILSKAMTKIEANPFPADLTYTKQMFDHLGYYAPFATRLSLANLWLLSPLVESVLLANSSTAAGIRTTTAVTMLEGSSKSNILPTRATGVVNFRLMPYDSSASVKQRIIEIIDDPRVEVEAYMVNEPSVVSKTDTFGFKLIASTIREMDQDVLVAPYLVMGGTDAKHFIGLSDSIYRFMMVKLDKQSLKQFHGVNEQISKQNYLNAVQFYYALLTKSAHGD